MNIWELPKDNYKWESPITKIYGDIHNEIVRQDEENCTYAIEQAIGYKVDKEELIKALQYDREQYDKGYKDGVRETFAKELEQLKAEIKEEEEKGIYYECEEWIEGRPCDSDYFYGLKRAIMIIDKHIGELK